MVAHPRHVRAGAQGSQGGELNDHLKLHKQGKETRKQRGTLLALALAALIVAAVLMAIFAPLWADGAAAAALFVALAMAGGPEGKTITSQAVLPATVAPPDQQVITRALGAVGIARITQAIVKGEFGPRNFPSPVREDGPGWRFEVDLPYGVTATQIIERREQLASGLRRPLGAVWPEVVSHEHAGRLECWVGPAGHQQGQACPVAVAAGRRGRRVRPAPVRCRPASAPRRRGRH